VNGLAAIELSPPRPADASRPHILSAQILPGRGMNIYQLRAWLPGKGEVNLFAAPPLEQAPAIFNGDPFGNASFAHGGAILVPFANRIRGKLSADGKTIATTIAGQSVNLPANFHGKNPGAEVHSMHGLILDLPFRSLVQNATAQEATVTAQADAGDFNGHWLSKTHLEISARLRASGFAFSVTAKNTGTQPLPIGVGWHPYFIFPSGDRTQARLRIPATGRVLVDNYDNVFPTGKVEPTAGTPYDFSNGAPLGKLFLDDCFVNVRQPLVAEITDPAAKYGMRIRSTSPQVTAYQVYAPVDKAFVAFEPQFNWGDPFNTKVWSDRPTGMVLLQPGESTTYTVELELFVP
jgi:galactose mutarotase-like enzyme